MVVSELFGPTFQGEGPSIGRLATFLRLGRCDLHCSWCDTPYTWDWTGRNGVEYSVGEELRRRDVGDVVQELLHRAAPLVVITGGEPLLQRRAVDMIAAACVAAGRDVEIETNGRHGPLATRGPAYNVSPKLSSSGDPEERRIRPDVLVALRETGAARFKFVCGDPEELDEVAAIVTLVGLSDDDVWIAPQATTAEALARISPQLAEATLARGWNFTSRLHVALWGDVRGR